MKPAADRMKLTYDDFLLFPDDGKRHELIDGEHYVTPSPNTKHQRVSGNLHFLIRAWLEDHQSDRSSMRRSMSSSPSLTSSSRTCCTLERAHAANPDRSSCHGRARDRCRDWLPRHADER